MTELNLNIWSILILFGAFHGVYLGAMILLKKENKEANRLFAAIVFIFTLHLIETASLTTGLIRYVPHLGKVTYPLLFLMGPFLYFYSESLKQPFQWNWKKALHFLPAIGFLIWMMPYFLLDTQTKLTTLNVPVPNARVRFELSGYLMGALFYLYNFTYITVVYRTVRQIKKANHLNQKEKLKTSWFSKVLMAYGGFIISCLVFYLIMAISGSYPQYYDYIHLTSMALMIHLVGYFVMNQPALFANSRKAAGQGKYDKSSLPQELSQRYVNDLYAYFESQQPYLREDLTLGQVAEGARLSKHHVSQVLNKVLGVSFYDFVNRYRVTEAKSLMESAPQEDVRLIDIGYQAGFGNKVSFYRAFKKLEGMSPSDYLKALSEKSNTPLPQDEGIG